MEKHLWKLSKFYVSWTEYTAFTKVFSIVPFSEHACFEGFLPICSYGCSFPVHFRHHLFCGVSIYQFLSNCLCSFPPKRYTTKALSMCLLKNFKGQIYRLVLSMVKKRLPIKFTGTLQSYFFHQYILLYNGMCKHKKYL